MSWVLLALAVALLLGRGARGGTPAAGRTGAGDPEVAAGGWDEADRRDLERMFAEVDAESAEVLLALLRTRMQDVLHRQVPVRAIRASPTRHVARICFSNGVVVLATTQRPGDLVPMAAAMLTTSVTLRTLELTPDGPLLGFGWHPQGRVQLVAVGLDQAD